MERTRPRRFRGVRRTRSAPSLTFQGPQHRADLEEAWKHSVRRWTGAGLHSAVGAAAEQLRACGHRPRSHPADLPPSSRGHNWVADSSPHSQEQPDPEQFIRMLPH